MSFMPTWATVLRMSQDKKIDTSQNLTRLHTGELSPWLVSEPFLTQLGMYSLPAC